jgi:hypothetical protein
LVAGLLRDANGGGMKPSGHRRDGPPGGEATDRPVQFGDVRHALSQSRHASKVTVNDLSGRPQYLVDAGCALKEVV